ncbi:MAG: baseplate J/gp47 family protein [Syntrophomonas sp.]
MALPDFLTEETEDVILARMLARIPDDIDKSEGSYIYDALAADASELAQLKIDMGQYLKRGFASTTFGEYLNLRCAERGIPRNQATKAEKTITFSGTVGTNIPQGTIVATPADATLGISSIEFETIQAATIGVTGSINVNVRALIAGVTGNVLNGTITLLVYPSISGISSVTNIATISDGVDTESDESLLERYLTKVQEPGTSGNIADYKTWAREVAGVGGVKVAPLWNGPGTVKVILLGTDKQPATQGIVDDAQEYIDPNPGQGEGKAPIGATVTVAAATSVQINITATVIRTGTKLLTEIKTAFETSLVDYFESIAFADDPTVRFVKIGALLLDTEGVQDYSNLQTNGGTGNIVINTGEVAVKGTVTLSE